MFTIELMEKDLMVLQLMIESEIKDNEKRIVKMREDEATGCYLLIDALKDRNKLLEKVKDKLCNTKKYVQEGTI